MPSLPQEGPYLVSLFRQNSLTLEHAQIIRQNTPREQQNGTKNRGVFGALSTAQQKPPFSFISAPTLASTATLTLSGSAVLSLGLVGLCGPPGSLPASTPADRAASGMPTAGGTQRVRGDQDLSEVTQEGWNKSDPPASSPWAVTARSSLLAGRQSTPFLEYTSSWTGCIRKSNHPQISPRLGYRTAFRRHALQSSLEGLAGGSAALSAHDPFWLSSRIMTPAAWVI